MSVGDQLSNPLFGEWERGSLSPPCKEESWVTSGGGRNPASAVGGVDRSWWQFCVFSGGVIFFWMRGQGGGEK